MQIEDIFENLELNFTSKWPLSNYRRFPDKEFHPYKMMLVDYHVFNTDAGGFQERNFYVGDFEV